MAKRKRPKKKLEISFALQLIDTEVSVNRFLGSTQFKIEILLATGDRFLRVQDLDRIAFDFQLRDLLLQCPNTNTIV